MDRTECNRPKQNNRLEYRSEKTIEYSRNKLNRIMQNEMEDNIRNQNKIE